MAWSVIVNNITMVEGDFGVELPITVTGATFTNADVLRLTFKDKMNGTTILEKEYSPADGAINLVFTEEESTLFPIGSYVYALDWFQNGEFMYNIISCATLKVVDKA